AEFEPGDHPLAGLRVGHRIEDRVLAEERVAREVHLRDQPLGKGAAEEREVDVRWPPGVGVVPPGIRAWLDGDELVPSVRVGHAPPAAVEVWIEWSRMVVDRV